MIKEFYVNRIADKLNTTVNSYVSHDNNNFNKFVPITRKDILSNVLFYNDILYDILHTALCLTFILYISFTNERKGKEKKRNWKIPKNIRERVGKKVQGGQRSLDLVRRDHTQRMVPSPFSLFYAVGHDSPDTLRVPPPPRLFLLVVVPIRHVECRPQCPRILLFRQQR